jgi:hypothetical protein
MRALPTDYRPLRVFVDSNALQALLDHGGTIFENEPFKPYGRSGADAVDVEALRGLMLFAGRGAFEFALSAKSLDEVAAAADPRYMQWAHDVLDHWEACLTEGGALTGAGAQRAARLDAGICGYLSKADARLVRDALLFECDTFLTIERKLTRNAPHMSRTLGIEAVRPPELWTVVRPHMGSL